MQLRPKNKKTGLFLCLNRMRSSCDDSSEKWEKAISNMAKYHGRQEKVMKFSKIPKV